MVVNLFFMRNKILIGILMLLASQAVSALVCWLLFKEVFLGATLAGTLPVIIILLWKIDFSRKSS